MAIRRHIPLQEFFLLKINPVIRFLIVADVVSYGAAGLLGPIFAVFVVDFIEGGSIEVAGVAVAVFLITKSVFQIPAAWFIDRVCGDMDDFWVLTVGMFFVSTLPLGYLFIDSALHLYIIQFLIGVGTAFTFPSFMAIFTRYVEPERAGTVWGIYYTMIDLASAATAAIGGVLAATIGFVNVIYAVTFIGWIGALLYLFVGPALEKTPPCGEPSLRKSPGV